MAIPARGGYRRPRWPEALSPPFSLPAPRPPPRRGGGVEDRGRGRWGEGTAGAARTARRPGGARWHTGPHGWVTEGRQEKRGR